MAATYLTLADELTLRIDTLDAGDRLPSEHELARDHGVSRITTRAALQELEHRHVVRRVRGSGTFVALGLPYPIHAGIGPSWSENVRRAGHVPSYDVLGVATVRAPAAIARRLEIPRGARVLRLERLGLVDGLVGAHTTSWFPVALVGDLIADLGDDGSTARVLRDVRGFRPARRSTEADLTPPPASVADELELVGRPPAWRLRSVNACLEHDRPVEYVAGWLRADTFRVSLRFGAGLDPDPRTTGRTGDDHD